MQVLVEPWAPMVIIAIIPNSDTLWNTAQSSWEAQLQSKTSEVSWLMFGPVDSQPAIRVHFFLHKALNPGNVLTHVNEDHWCKWPRPLCGSDFREWWCANCRNVIRLLTGMCVLCRLSEQRLTNNFIQSVIAARDRAERNLGWTLILNVLSITAADCWESSEVCLLLHLEHNNSGSIDWHGPTHLSSPLRLFN